MPREPKAYTVLQYSVDRLSTTWEFKLEPTVEQVTEIERTLDVSRNIWNFVPWERKDWLNSGKSPVHACSIGQEYILPVDKSFPKSYVQADVDIPNAMPHGQPASVDVGLESFLSNADGEQVKQPRFFQ